MNETALEITITVAKAAVVIGMLMSLASMTTWLERKLSALMQDRVGANRASFFGWDLAGLINTLVADPTKAIMKEDWLPKGVSQFMHSLAPFLAVFPVIASFAVIPFGPPLHINGKSYPLQLANLDMGMLYALAMGSLAVYGVVLAGWVSENKFSLIGGIRASAQMISYEVTLGVSLLGVVIVYQTLEPARIVELQGATLFGFLPAWGVFLNPVGCVLFFWSMMAETKRAPFDVPEAESEIVAGYMTEYSGMKFLLFWLGEFAEIVVTSALVVVLFFGGWQLPWIDLSKYAWGPYVAFAVFSGKVFLFCIIQEIIRWTLPRFRYDQLMNLCWKMMLPVGLANVVVTAAVVLWLKG